MNTSEAARKWKCSAGTVRKYCNEGMIPPAEKSTRFPWGWNVPDEACKPPVTRHKAVVIMCMASAVREGGKVNINTLGIPENLVRDAFQYLQDCGFIAMYEAQHEIMEAMKSVQILPLGKKLIEADDEASKSKVKKSAEVELGYDRTGPHVNLTFGLSNT
jgi:hypothetical protein